MKIMQALKMALKSIASNKMRSFLTMLGIIIGVLSVTVLVGLAQGATNDINTQMSSLGTNMLTVSMRGRRTINLKLDEVMALRGQNGIDTTAPLITSNLTVKAGVNTHETSVEGTTDGYDKIRQYEIAEGRFLTEADIASRNAVCVVGVTVADELFGQRHVVGEEINIDGRKYQVVGVYAEKGSMMGVSQDDRVTIPFTLAQRTFRNTSINQFFANTVNEESVDGAVAALEDFMQKKTNDEDAYNVNNQAQLLETLNEMLGTMTLLLAGIAGISLLVGGIGIMNIMLVSVSERTREIGIRKAIGAQRLDIMLQFIIEAVAISITGGLIGLGLGFAVKFFVAPMIGLPMSISTTVALLALGFSIVIGVLFGSYPANKAAKLLPIEALRYE